MTTCLDTSKCESKIEVSRNLKYDVDELQIS